MSTHGAFWVIMVFMNIGNVIISIHKILELRSQQRFLQQLIENNGSKWILNWQREKIFRSRVAIFFYGMLVIWTIVLTWYIWMYWEI